MTNMELAQRVIESLLAAGVREFCLCAGARNSPFVDLFAANPHLKTYSFFEERSASFFALGRIAATRHPVAIITTSGTAVAECVSAAVEATYSALPLLIVSADRPKRFRGSGAPQTIDQVGIFSYYIEACFDLDEDNTHLSFNGLSWKKPVHLNVCFNEPLLDAPPAQISPPTRELRTRFPEAIPMQMVDELDEFLAKHRPLVLLSTIPEKYLESVVSFLARLQAPIYAEGISGLRGHPELKDLEIRSGERMLQRLIDQEHCDSILRLGGVPTVRLWRDLEDRRASLPVFSLGYNHFTGLSREIPHYEDLGDLGGLEIKRSAALDDSVRIFDHEMAERARELFAKYPSAEPSLVHALSKSMKGAGVYLGNSLPIREWDLAADFDCVPKRVVGNRGANGIDGQISTFLGWSRPDAANWCMVGDLTALYDSSALWITPQLADMKLRIAIINNNGGMIFKKMFGKEIYLNRHEIKFKSWAEQWGWDYVNATEWSADRELSDRQIIELTVSEQQTEAFWAEWDRAWS